jgi:hypothetical protein
MSRLLPNRQKSWDFCRIGKVVSVPDWKINLGIKLEWHLTKQCLKNYNDAWSTYVYKQTMYVPTYVISCTYENRHFSEKNSHYDFLSSM